MKENRRFLPLAGVLAVVLAVLVLSNGCALTGKYKALYGVADWVEINHMSLQDRYAAATDEEKAYLYKHVNPYMNVLKHATVGLAAMDQENDVKLAEEITAIQKEVTAGALDYNPLGLITALRNKDYTALELEVLRLQRLIREYLL